VEYILIYRMWKSNYHTSWKVFSIFGMRNSENIMCSVFFGISNRIISRNIHFPILANCLNLESFFGMKSFIFLIRVSPPPFLYIEEKQQEVPRHDVLVLFEVYIFCIKIYCKKSPRPNISKNRVHPYNIWLQFIELIK